MKAPDEIQKSVKPDRRKFLTLISLGILGAIAAPLLLASKRFLDPQTSAALETQNWKTLGAISELGGAVEPVARTVSVEANAGWIKTIEDVTVYVLPQDEHKVLSSVCPHEGCPVVWDSATKNFLCPCHDSFFSASGKKLTGPANADLAVLETRVEDGKLQIRI